MITIVTIDTNQLMQDIGNVDDILIVISKLQDYGKHKNPSKMTNDIFIQKRSFKKKMERARLQNVGSFEVI